MKKFLFALLLSAGVLRLLAYLNRRRVTIVCYHGVTPREAPIPNDEHKLHVPFSLFVEHLDYLQRCYNIISLEEFIKAHRDRRALPPRAVILTFEDGIRNFFTVAAPELTRRGLPATTFIITGLTLPTLPVDSNHEWQPDDDSLFLSWPDVHELAGNNIQFGSHTVSHPKLVDLPLELAERELTQSRAALRTQLQQAAFALSYPYGEYSDEICALTKKAGYSCGITTKPGSNDADSNLFALKRIVISGDDDLPTFAARACGLTSWFSDFRDGTSKITVDVKPSVAYVATPLEEAD